MDDKEKRASEQREIIKESQKEYRQSGLGLSATFITLSLLLLSRPLLEKLVEATPNIVWYGVVCKMSLTLSILFAISIQVFHYLGTKYYSRMNTHFYIIKFETHQAIKDKVGDQFLASFSKLRLWFAIADIAVFIALGCFALGATLWIYLNPNFF
jgi:hypothetical protein